MSSWVEESSESASEGGDECGDALKVGEGAEFKSMMSCGYWRCGVENVVWYFFHRMIGSYDSFHLKCHICQTLKNQKVAIL